MGEIADAPDIFKGKVSVFGKPTPRQARYPASRIQCGESMMKNSLREYEKWQSHMKSSLGRA